MWLELPVEPNADGEAVKVGIERGFDADCIESGRLSLEVL
jgi:hypothetical protein